MIQEEVQIDLQAANQQFNHATASAMIRWAGDTFGDRLVLSTSFGIHSAVMLHLVTQILPNIPVIWIDTGYLHKETYLYAEQLTNHFKLNLKVYQSQLSSARMEALYGKLWLRNDLESLNLHDQIRKVEPMQRALQELRATAWLSGLRKDQTDHRQNLEPINLQGSIYKVLPILYWSSQDVSQYMQTHHLPTHPLVDQGYVTIGDWFSSRPVTAADQNDRDTRFHGLKQECGLHLPLAL